MSDGLYFCPASREVESATGGGFTTCCDRLQDHLPMPDTAATAAVSEALSGAVKREFKLGQQLAELNAAITWETTCLNCSSMLTRSYEDYCRADALAAAVLSVSNELTQSGSHDAAGRLGDALDRYQETASDAPAFPSPLRPDGTHFYVSTYCVHLRHAECRLTCLCCGQPCQCAGCEHETATEDETAPDCRWPACLSEADQQLLAEQVGASMLGEATALMPDPRPGCGCVDRGVGRAWVAGGPGCGFPSVPPRRHSAELQQQVAERFGFPLRTPATGGEQQ